MVFSFLVDLFVFGWVGEFLRSGTFMLESGSTDSFEMNLSVEMNLSFEVNPSVEMDLSFKSNHSCGILCCVVCVLCSGLPKRQLWFLMV